MNAPPVAGASGREHIDAWVDEAYRDLRRMARARLASGGRNTVLDTTALTVHELRRRVRESTGEADAIEPLAVTILSFGFRHGSPAMHGGWGPGRTTSSTASRSWSRSPRPMASASSPSIATRSRARPGR